MEADNIPTEMDLLMFRAADINMAVDTVQVDSIVRCEQEEQYEGAFCTLNELLGLGKETSSVCSSVILFKNGNGEETYGLRVNGLEAIITVPLKAIQPIPEPLAYFAGPRMFWGVLLQGDRVVLLIDLYRLKGLKSYKAVPTA